MVLLILLWILTTACACDPAGYSFSGEDIENVVSVELIEYDNPEQKQFLSWVPNHSSDLKPFDFSKMTRLKTLDEAMIPEFLDSLTECEVLYTYYAYDSPNSLCIKVNYEDGDFMIVWSNFIDSTYSGYIGRFSASGQVERFIGCFQGLDSYLFLVNNYFHVNI